MAISSTESNVSEGRVSPGALDHLSEYVAQATRQRFARMMLHARRVCTDHDPESVRKMRVWSRRSQSALDVASEFFGVEAMEPLQRELKSVGQALGEVRDLDVHMDVLRIKGEALPPNYRECLEPLLSRLVARRQEEQVKAVLAVNLLERSNLLQQFEAVVGVGAVSNASSMSPYSLESAARVISCCMDGVHEYERYVSQPDCAAELHKMRIAMRRLRYTMEIFENLVLELSPNGARFSSAIQQIEPIQEQLGAIHDADVLIPVLVAELTATLTNHGIEDADGTTPRSIYGDFDACQGLLMLCLEIRTTRNRWYNDLVRQWSKLREERTLENMLDLPSVEEPLSTPNESGSAAFQNAHAVAGKASILDQPPGGALGESSPWHGDGATEALSRCLD